MPDPTPSAPVGLTPVNWSTQRLSRFLAVVSAARGERTASRLAVDRA
jgi:hypothetical protein